MDALETVKLVLVEESSFESKQGDCKSETKVKVISNTKERRRVEECWRATGIEDNNQINNNVDHVVESEIGILMALNERTELRKICEWTIVKDCCISMSEFEIFSEKSIFTNFSTSSFSNSDNVLDIETGIFSTDNHGNDKNITGSRGIIQTKCGHLSHRACIHGWVGGNWDWSIEFNQTENSNGIASFHYDRARRQCCPLCRNNLLPI